MSKYAGNIVTTGADAGYSVYFPGANSSYVVMTNASAVINPTTSTTPFTIECWVYTNGTTTTTLYAALASENYGFTLGFGGGVGIYDSNQTPWFGNYTGSWNGIRSSTPVAFRTWTHIACVFTGSTCYIYQNGVLTASGGPSSWGVTGSSKVRIGCRPDATTDNFNGYIAGARVVIGSNLYPGGTTFTPPTVPLNITNTQLLVCNSPAIIDQSNNAFALTVNGTAAASTLTPFAGYQAYSPALGAATPGVWGLTDALNAAATRQWNMYDPYFNYTTLKLSGTPVTNVPTWITDASTNNFAVTVNGDARAAGLSPFSLTTYPNSGSGYFDGAGDYLTVAANTAFNLGTGDFTIECWFYYATTPPAGSGYDYIWGIGGNNVNGLGLYVQGGVPKIWNGSSVLTTTGSISATTWYHAAVVRASGTLTVYLNGASIGSVSLTSNLSGGGSVGFNIARWINASDAEEFPGHISNLRIVKGTALYTTTFTPSTAPLTAVTNTSLLTLQNSQSSNNSAFLDSSSNNFLITRNGNTTQGTFTPFSQTGWSNYFDGASWLGVTNAAFAFGTGDFSVTFYMYRIAGTYAMGTGNTSGSWAFTMTGSFRINTLASDLITANAPLNQWSKIQATRVGTTISLYLNDVLQGTATSAQNFTNTAFALGSFGQTTTFAGTCYISNVVIVKAGVTVFDSCRNNRFLDNSPSPLTSGFTFGGTPSVQAFSPFLTNVAYTPALQGGSAYFDGTGDYLTMASSTNLNVGAGQFTFEAWIYPTGGAGTFRCIYYFGPVSDDALYVSSGNLLMMYRGGNLISIASPTIKLNEWAHVAVSRDSSNNVRVFLNGQSSSAATSTYNFNNNTPRLGSNGAAGGAELFTGYISGARLLKGVGVTSVAVPAAPPQPIADTQLLLNFTNAGIVDTTAKTVFETLGTAAVTTAVNKYGGSSLYFNGSGNCLLAPNSPNFDLGSGSFTIETWINFNSTVDQTIIAKWWTGGQQWVLQFRAAGSDSIANQHWRFYANNGTTAAVDFQEASSTAITTGVWYHIALVRNGSSYYFFRNGVQIGTTYTNAATITATTDLLSVGQFANSGQAGNILFAYLQDLRITKGYARYIGSFTPPTSLLQNQ